MTAVVKPVVRYHAVAGNPVIVGQRAVVRPLNHTSPYVSNETEALTSTVQAVGPDGSFETRNSRYVLAD